MSANDVKTTSDGAKKEVNTNNTKTNALGVKALYLKEDYWAVWIGLAAVIIALIVWAMGGSIKGVTLKFAKYDSFSEIPGCCNNWLNVFVLYIILAAAFGLGTKIMGRKLSEFIKGFTLLYIMAIIVQILGAWSVAKAVNLEAPVMALIVGMIIGNFVKIPDWFDAGMRTEFYVKTGIVLFGATMPFTLILKSGPVAFLQATIVAVTTFLVIYWAGTRLFGLEKPFAATLGAGGSICGVSASIAIGSSVNAKKDHVSIAISMVVIWATVMVFGLPIVCRALGVSDGVAGAWIGTSEFADAAGVAAAAQFGDGANTTFILMKVVGRDIFVGIWALVLAIISVTMWEKEATGQKPGGSVIWERFPKFVLGFFIASIIITLVMMANPDPAVQDEITKLVCKPIKNFRGWCFVLCFLCIGLTTRFKDLAATGWKPFGAFTCGVVVNVGLGYLLSCHILADYWTQVGLGA